MINLVDELLAVCGALVGGARYGLKIRLPHALVMTVLFHNDLSKKEKLRYIFKLGFEHAANLASFATIYKASLVSLKWCSRRLRLAKDDKRLVMLLCKYIVDGPSPGVVAPTSMAGQPERAYHALLAGATGGYVVWGKYSSVNYQIVLYLTSRILIGLSKRCWEKFSPIEYKNMLQHPKTYSLLSAAVWGVVMVLFEETPHVLHRSLKTSMDEIYRYQISSFSSHSTIDDDKGEV
ncbi:unnamed protein product [Cylindrotheca closterium]|uniref:Peroxisomal membrane protein 4 n=1 Tax=Cylindrotheca closterium TaxID=2856 RepID=A0AAD2FKH6_9STRA|nr:unnamed protein product [Cylindrotheca closterium]